MKNNKKQTGREDNEGFTSTQESFINEQAPLPGSETDAFAGREEDDWEKVNQNIQVWDYETKPEVIAYFKGTGKTLGEGARATKTWLMEEVSSGEEFFVPQWTSVESLGKDTELGHWIYRLQYRGKRNLDGGNSFHVVNVAKKKAPKPINVAKDRSFE